MKLMHGELSRIKTFFLVITLCVAAIMCMGCVTKSSIASSGTTYFLSENDLSLYKRKSLDGDSLASLKVAQHYTFFRFDIIEATFWFRLSAENGNSVAEMNLANIYQEHYKNDEKATYWYSKTIEKEPILANNRIADMLWSKGRYDEAMRYYTESAWQGSTRGMERIAVYNSEISYGKINYMDGYIWASLLVKRLPENTFALQEAQDLVKKIENLLTVDEKDKAINTIEKYDKKIPRISKEDGY